jgi:triosephosphate isomerase
MAGSSRKTIIAGNWKMHKTRAEGTSLAQAIVDGIKGERGLPEVILCPPFTCLNEVKKAIEGSPLVLGAQNMEYRESGAHTGEISPLMITDIGATYVIVGHSERRQFYGETNSTVNLKTKSALKHKLIPIVCVGESLDEREEGLTDSVVRRQIGAALADLSRQQVALTVVAYEPVWAIGTGKNCEPKEANRVASLIRATINELYHGTHVGDVVPILYGGSVKPSNVKDQLAEPEVDGALVGGASLTSDDFLALIKAGAGRVQAAARR